MPRICGKSTPETFRDLAAVSSMWTVNVIFCEALKYASSAAVEIVTVGRQSSVKNEDKSPAQAELGRGTLKCSDGPPDRAYATPALFDTIFA